MNYELAKQLKDAGFPYKKWTPEFEEQLLWDEGDASVPATLEELIEACLSPKEEECFYCLDFDEDDYSFTALAGTADKHYSVTGKTPTEAVAKLWLALTTN